MGIKKIEKSAWGAYFDAFSRQFRGTRRTDYAEIRVFSKELGAHKETSWLPLVGITYDRKDDLLEVAVENMDHLIYHPDQIYVDEAGVGVIKSLQIIRKDGTREVIELR